MSAKGPRVSLPQTRGPEAHRRGFAETIVESPSIFMPLITELTGPKAFLNTLSGMAGAPPH